MKSLLILRHAKSSWKEPDATDHDRPLNQRGERDAPRIGALLQAQNLVPDLIVSSTAKRAVMTTQAVAEAADYGGTIQLEDNLYLGAPAAYVEQLALLPDNVQRVMMVGHNPGLEELLFLLTRQTRTFPTAALAVVQWDAEDWKAVAAHPRNGQLSDFWIPKALP